MYRKMENPKEFWAFVYTSVLKMLKIRGGERI